GSRPRATLPLHWRTQPVILVASDGRSASIRSRLLQPGSSRTRSSGIGGGMYHDQVVLEDGIWRLWSVTIDEHYYSSAYEGGWSTATAAAPGGRATAAAPGGRGATPAPGVGQGPARGQAPAQGRGQAPAAAQPQGQ